MNARPHASYRDLVAAGEPFRLLFPLGVLFGLAGVLLWPAFAWNLLSPYPALIHPRIMIQCFMGAFVIGFLGTALPRLLDVPRVRGREVCGYAAGLTAVFALHLLGMRLAGDVAFLLVFGAFVGGLVFRARHRKDVPPPGFVLVILGLLSALAGTALLVLAETAAAAGAGGIYQAGRLLLYQGFLLFPVMGVGAFLLPRFFQLPSRQDFPESRTPPPGWWSRAGFALACGLAVLAGFAAEVFGSPAAGSVLRAGAVLVYFWREVPAHKAKFSTGSLASALRVALLSIPVGYAAIAVWSSRSLALLHVVFITGCALLTLTVASRVILGHGGQSDRFKAVLPSVLALAALSGAALALRIAADFAPAARFALYGVSGLAWAAGVLIWAGAILPGVRKAGAE